MRGQLVARELAQHHGLLLGEHAGVEQLAQHALDAVRVFAHILDEQDAARHIGQERRAYQRGEHCQVSAPQRCILQIDIGHGRRAIGTRRLLVHAPAAAFAPAREQVVEAVEHDVVGFLGRAEIGAQGRAGPADAADARQQRALERSEVAQANELGAALDGLGHGRVVDLRQQPAQAVAAARNQRHVGAAGSRAVDGGQPRGVVAREARGARQCVGIDFDIMAQRAQARDAALERRLVVDRARRRVEIDTARTGGVTAAGAIGVMLMMVVGVMVVVFGGLRRQGIQAVDAACSSKTGARGRPLGRIQMKPL